MQVTVFHRDNFDPREESGFSPVAKVDVTHCMSVDQALEFAFRFTNNIEGSWSKGETFEFNGEVHDNPDFNPAVEFIGEYPVGKNGQVYGARSTSMHDRMEVNGVMYEVAAFGFDVVEAA